MKLPVIAVVGRPNVGKSTLFNRVLGERKAVVEDEPGVTRDRNYGTSRRFSIPFIVIDTGGLEMSSDGSPLDSAVREQALLAIQEADATVVVFDAEHGVHPGDELIVSTIRERGARAYFVANKCDGVEHNANAAEFYSLGLDEITGISALHGQGVRETFERVLQGLPNYEALRMQRDEALPRWQRSEEEVRAEWKVHEDEFEEVVEIPEEEPSRFEEVQFAEVYRGEDSETYLSQNRFRDLEAYAPQEEGGLEEPQGSIERGVRPELIQFCLIGRPNAGKSTLLNRLVGSERSITSPIAGTTRDSVDVELKRDGKRFLIVDTAGLRRKSKIADSIEQFSVVRALKSISDSDVAVVVIDATRGVETQDTKIAGIAHELGKGVVFAVNKWDAVEKNYKSVREFTENLRSEMKFGAYAPVVFLSALTGKRCPKLLDAVEQIAVSRRTRVRTGQLNRMLRAASKRANLPSYRGRKLKLLFASQVADCPPTFMVFVNYPDGIHFSFTRFLKNSIRSIFEFEGTDLKILYRRG